MLSTVDYFEKNKYVVLENALTLEQGAVLTKHMFDLYEQGKLVKDEQCPLSDAIYGDPVFDDMLVKFAEPIGKAVGKRLLPTYTYSRIYRPGEVLKKHVDRPACEISATLTLGYDSKPIWPIFVNEEKQIPVPLDVGEMVVYRGCELVHWRPEFKGKWHVQVFLHYVDADGPFKEHAKDGRQQYGTQKQSNVAQPNKQETQTSAIIPPSKPYHNSIIIPPGDLNFPGYVCFNSGFGKELMFTPEECDKIISYAKRNYPTNASVGADDGGRIQKQIRSADIYSIERDPEFMWVYDKVIRAVSIANNNHFDYDIAGITHNLQLIHYKSTEEIPGHYDWHIDAGPGEFSLRKISYVAQISDPSDYSGCELLINNHGTEVYGSKERGSIHLFPSYLPHKVIPITGGERYSLVIWVHGSRRFR